MTDIKISNRSAILRLLHESGAMSRKQIAARLNLTPATITVIINELMNESILAEGISVPNAGIAGRREVLVEICRDKYISLGIAIEREQARISAVNLCGELTCEASFPLSKDVTAKQFVDIACEQIQGMIEREGYVERYIIGLGIIICGIVDCANGIILDSDGIWSDKDVPIVKMMRERLSFPVIVANNVRSYANAYVFLQRDPKMQNVLFIRNEATMGASVILDGQFYDGDRNLSAGIAHYTIVPGGRLCHCGRRGCLDTVASQNGMLASLGETFCKEKTPLLYEWSEGDISKITFSKFLESAYSGDPGAAEIVHKAQEIFANAITFSIQLLDVQTIVFYGDMFKNAEFFEALQKLLIAKTHGSYNENIYKVVPSNMRLELVAASIMVISFFVYAGGYKSY